MERDINAADWKIGEKIALFGSPNQWQIQFFWSSLFNSDNMVA